MDSPLFAISGGIRRSAILGKHVCRNPLSHWGAIGVLMHKFIFNIAFTILPFQKVRKPRASRDARLM
jgi:hypothetical protein